MNRYIFNYNQLHETWCSLTLGALTPTSLYMAPLTFSQFKEFYAHNTPPREQLSKDDSMTFRGAPILKSPHAPEGCVVFIGGAHVMELEESE